MKRFWISAALISPSGLVLAVDTLHSDPIAPVILGVTTILYFFLLSSGAMSHAASHNLRYSASWAIGIALGNLVFLLGGDFILVLREGPALFDMVELTLGGMSFDQAAARRVGDPVVAQKMIEVVRGPHGGQLLAVAHTIDVFSRYGVIFLLFLVGMLVAFGLGLGVAWVAVPDNSIGALLFIAATLGATSVGIRARVLFELQVLGLREANIVLGAAIFDDVLGLVSLAIVSGIVINGTVEGDAIARILGLSTLFVLAALFAGPNVLRTIIRAMRGMELLEAQIFVAFLFVKGLSRFAGLVGLATIIGAFAAGLIVNDCYFCEWEDDCYRSTLSIKSLMAPLEAILVPIFFVLIGMQVKLESFLSGDVLLFAGGLTVAAIVGKLASGYVAGRGLNALAIGLDMLPRGEVGLIFASIGKALGVIDDQLFSAIVLMVVITTVIAPSLLKWSLRRGVCKNGGIEPTAMESK